MGFVERMGIRGRLVVAQQQAQASECVAKLGGNAAFWAYADRIYAHTASNGHGVSGARPLARLEHLVGEWPGSPQ